MIQKIFIKKLSWVEYNQNELVYCFNIYKEDFFLFVTGGIKL